MSRRSFDAESRAPELEKALSEIENRPSETQKGTSEGERAHFEEGKGASERESRTSGVEKGLSERDFSVFWLELASSYERSQFRRRIPSFQPSIFLSLEPISTKRGAQGRSPGSPSFRSSFPVTLCLCLSLTVVPVPSVQQASPGTSSSGPGKWLLSRGRSASRHPSQCCRR